MLSDGISAQKRKITFPTLWALPVKEQNLVTERNDRLLMKAQRANLRVTIPESLSAE